MPAMPSAPAPPNTASDETALDPEFLALLRCPACDDRPPVRLSEAGDVLVCERCERRYPIVDGLPSLLVEAADEPPAPEA